MWEGLRQRLLGNDVFLSYSSNDGEWAEAIEKLLKGRRYRVFRDSSGLNTGEHLERLLSEVRRSTMLTVLVSDSSMASDWVYRELTAYLERPKKRWRISPVFLDARYPRELPDRFSVLADFHGVKLPLRAPGHLTHAAPLARDLTGQFDALRKATVQWISVTAMAIMVGTTITWLTWTIDRNSRRDALLKQAEVAEASARFDEAEVALAHAWDLDPDRATLEGYRRVRARRAIDRPSWLAVRREEGILAVDEAAGAPYAVLHSDDEKRSLVVLRDGRRTVLASPCEAAPLVSTTGSLIVWVCDKRLGAAFAHQPERHTVELPAAPLHIRLAGDRIELLFRQGDLVQVGVFQAPALHPLERRVLEGSTQGGELGFCPDAAQFVWVFHVEEGRIASRRWERNAVRPKVETFAIPDPGSTGRSIASSISRVIPAADCERFFVEYARFTLAARSTPEMVRIRLNAVRSVDQFDTSVDRLAPAPDETGIEAIYLTQSKELRVFLLTSPVVLTTQVRTLASDVHRLASWRAREDRAAWSVALGRDDVSVYRNQDLWSRHPLGVGEPLRVVPSRDGRWLAIEGEERTILWRRAGPWSGSVPPAADAIERDVRLPAR